ncbi:MAG: helix-hairpin-helix domain-containing protein [Desulfomonile tiedjei]|nr:helix-hairpin-helix domain-containing protein [Desulfomonile tiedjei]
MRKALTIPRSKLNEPTQLEDLPNIGKSIAADLRRIGIFRPDQLAEREPIAVFRALSEVMGHRHDPCVLYTLMSVKHFLKSGEAVPWWKFTAEGKDLLKSSKDGGQQ